MKDKIVKQSKLEKNLKEYLKDESFGDNNDKLRLLLTYLIGIWFCWEKIQTLFQLIKDNQKTSKSWQRPLNH